MGHLNKQLWLFKLLLHFSLKLTVHKSIMDCVIAILDGIFFALTVLSKLQLPIILQGKYKLQVP
jgi:hypothetical protein